MELKNIIPPTEIQNAMEKQMKAERERREAILKAEGEKKSTILVDVCVLCSVLCDVSLSYLLFILALQYLYVVQVVFKVQGILRQELQFRCNLLKGSFIPLRSSF